MPREQFITGFTATYAREPRYLGSGANQTLYSSILPVLVDTAVLACPPEVTSFALETISCMILANHFPRASSAAYRTLR